MSNGSMFQDSNCILVQGKFHALVVKCMERSMLVLWKKQEAFKG